MNRLDPYQIESPDGVIYTVTNENEFARQHGLQQAGLGKARRVNIKREYKGWKFI